MENHEGFEWVSDIARQPLEARLGLMEALLWPQTAGSPSSLTSSHPADTQADISTATSSRTATTSVELQALQMSSLAKQSSSDPQGKSPFRFLDLPKELQYEVLTHLPKPDRFIFVLSEGTTLVRSSEDGIAWNHGHSGYRRSFDLAYHPRFLQVLECLVQRLFDIPSPPWSTDADPDDPMPLFPTNIRIPGHPLPSPEVCRDLIKAVRTRLAQLMAPRGSVLEGDNSLPDPGFYPTPRVVLPSLEDLEEWIPCYERMYRCASPLLTSKALHNKFTYHVTSTVPHVLHVDYSEVMKNTFPHPWIAALHAFRVSDAQDCTLEVFIEKPLTVPGTNRAKKCEVEFFAKVLTLIKDFKALLFLTIDIHFINLELSFENSNTDYTPLLSNMVDVENAVLTDVASHPRLQNITLKIITPKDDRAERTIKRIYDPDVGSRIWTSSI